jgi:acyl carrier protein
MMMTLEEEFGICITEEEAESLDTVGKIVKFVDEEQSSRRPSI